MVVAICNLLKYLMNSARFVRAVSELQFLGLIKATNKKFDHVTRLTWSVY